EWPHRSRGAAASDVRARRARARPAPRRRAHRRGAAARRRARRRLPSARGRASSSSPGPAASRRPASASPRPPPARRGSWGSPREAASRGSRRQVPRAAPRTAPKPYTPRAPLLKSAGAGQTGGGPSRPAPGHDLLLLRFDDLAALLLALGLGRLDPRLALARVLTLARVRRARARPLPLARVDAHAVDGIAAGLLGGDGDDGAAQEQSRRRARDQHSPARSVHAHPPWSWMDQAALAPGRDGCQDTRF